ncbi:hypothetical protein SGL43_07413 [Streptomyces globisporus]|uniref:Transposase n=1 Tax=Streptomyces globisporus TaxID=1908 RepID=A0ABM9H9J3_STRGL|nr:hypothetical protein SGL43_07413 [Streptomyces globisporus]
MRDRFGEHAGPEKGDLTGRNPVDRGKFGSKIRLITDRTGLPLPSASPAPVSTTARHLSRSCAGYRRSDPPWPASTTTGQTLCGQGLRQPPLAAMAPFPAHHTPHRP